MIKRIKHNHRTYYYYDTFNKWITAQQTGKYYKRLFKKKSTIQWLIMKHEKGFLFPQYKYSLYLTKNLRLV